MGSHAFTRTALTIYFGEQVYAGAESSYPPPALISGRNKADPKRAGITKIQDRKNARARRKAGSRNVSCRPILSAGLQIDL